MFYTCTRRSTRYGKFHLSAAISHSPVYDSPLFRMLFPQITVGLINPMYFFIAGESTLKIIFNLLLTLYLIDLPIICSYDLNLSYLVFIRIKQLLSIYQLVCVRVIVHCNLKDLCPLFLLALQFYFS